MTAAAVIELPTPAAGVDRVELLPPAAITPAADNPRRQVGDVAELAASIRSVGLLEPLVVTPRDGGYLLVCGARRHAAAIAAGLDVVPAIVREFDEPTRQEAMLIENLQRTDLTVLEEATAYRRLVELGHSQRQLAERVGRSQGHVSKRLALLDLPDKVQQEVDSGGITVGDALELVKLAAHPERLRKVLKRKSWKPLQSAIKEQLHALEIEQQVATIRRNLEADGLRVIESASDVAAYWFNPPAGVYMIGDGWDELPLDPEKHASEPCHAVGIEPLTGQAVPLCTDRSCHPKAKTRAEGGAGNTPRKLTAEEKAAQKLRADLEAAVERRRAFAGELVRGKVAKDDVVAIAAEALLVYEMYEGPAIAAAMLQLLAADADEDADELDSEDIEAMLIVRAGQSGAERLRVTLALAFGAIEQQLGIWNEWGRGARAYLDLLQQHGYEISDAERRKLEQAGEA